jgi:hypothetical protein
MRKKGGDGDRGMKSFNSFLGHACVGGLSNIFFVRGGGEEDVPGRQ